MCGQPASLPTRFSSLPFRSSLVCARGVVCERNPPHALNPWHPAVARGRCLRLVPLGRSLDQSRKFVVRFFRLGANRRRMGTSMPLVGLARRAASCASRRDCGRAVTGLSVCSRGDEQSAKPLERASDRRSGIFLVRIWKTRRGRRYSPVRLAIGGRRPTLSVATAKFHRRKRLARHSLRKSFGARSVLCTDFPAPRHY